MDGAKIIFRTSLAGRNTIVNLRPKINHMLTCSQIHKMTSVNQRHIHIHNAEISTITKIQDQSEFYVYETITGEEKGDECEMKGGGFVPCFGQQTWSFYVKISAMNSTPKLQISTND